MAPPRFLRVLPALLIAAGLATPAAARVVPISPVSRVGPVRDVAGDGLRMRFQDVASGCGLALCRAATDTVTTQVTSFPNIDFLLNTGSTLGPFNHGGGYFETRWDSYLNVKVPGDYVFSFQADDCAEIAIGDSTILFMDGGHWYENRVSDTVRFVTAGSYPFRAYYADCQPCCRGFRFGGMGPEGSGMMAFTSGFDFNTDLGPCCTFGSNGPGISLVPAALFFTTAGLVDAAAPLPPSGPGTLLGAHAAPNPSRGTTVLSVELARDQRLWAEIMDAAGRRVATLAAGERHHAGRVSWPWSADARRPGAGASGTYFYRVWTEDGASLGGRILVVR